MVGAALCLLQILQDCPEEPEAMNDEEQFEEIEAIGKSLLDRLTIPVVYPDGYVHVLINLFFRKIPEYLHCGPHFQLLQ